MEESQETNVSLKLLIDTESHRVLFAEADKNFIDFLFHILALPVGTFIALLTKQGMPKVHISGGGTGVPLLLPNVESSSSASLKFYKCARNNRSYYGYGVCVVEGGCAVVAGNCNNCNYVANDNRAICPSCKNVMNHELDFVHSPSATNEGSSFSEGGYVKGVVTYMVMDDLVVKPMSTISSITLLNRFNVKDVGALEEKVIHLGIDEGVKLLKASLQSKNVLTDVFLPMLKVEIESVM
nr:hypothetical protein CFP56_75373 [Quercus suber]